MKKSGVNSTNGLNSDPSKSVDNGHSSSGSGRRVCVNGSSSVAYTEEEVTIVREIKRKKEDHYEILGLEKTCSVDDIRKAYRKLSLKVHPDKNQAPGAEEAFKLVSKAFQCLSDAESRKTYDVVVGSDEQPAVYERRTPEGGGGGADEEIFTGLNFGAPGVNVRMVYSVYNNDGSAAGGSNFMSRLLLLMLVKILKIFIKSLCFFLSLQSHFRLIVVAVLIAAAARSLEVMALEVVRVVVLMAAATMIVIIMQALA